ncbi:MAG: DNA-binding protein WhiA [Clostridia bacterium]|nr:DNA-binding protein WhiA [Clostridia bacterium]
MSFSTDVRGELARVKTDDVCCARSELAAALLASGGIAWRGRGRYALTITATDAATVRRYFGMLKRHWGVTGQIRALSGDRLNGLTRYQLAIPEEASLQLLEEFQIYDEAAPFGVRQTPGDGITHYACCKKAFVRAAFLMCGEVSNPEKAYHIEVAAPTEDFARRVADCLGYFGIACAIAPRKAKFVAYIKRAEGISDMLSLLGAGAAVLALENIRVRKEVSNHVNRQMNFDSSNINRTVDAAETVIRDIQYIDRELGLEKLPPTLRDMAYARANNPETPLAGLGELVDPPIGKSGVNARLRRLADIADKLRSGEEIKLRKVSPVMTQSERNDP